METHISALKQELETGTMKPEAAQAFTRLVSALRRCTAESLRVVAKKCFDFKNVLLKYVSVYQFFIEKASVVLMKKIVEIAIGKVKISKKL